MVSEVKKAENIENSAVVPPLNLSELNKNDDLEMGVKPKAEEAKIEEIVTGKVVANKSRANTIDIQDSEDDDDIRKVKITQKCSKTKICVLSFALLVVIVAGVLYYFKLVPFFRPEEGKISASLD